VTELCEVVITAPDPDWLLTLTRQLVNDGLCASVHNFSPVRSIYKWHGKVEERTEGRASLHTRRDLIPAIVERVRAVHPYEVPGISARPIIDGNPEYLQWILDQTGRLSARSRPRSFARSSLCAHACGLEFEVWFVGPGFGFAVRFDGGLGVRFGLPLGV